MADDPVQQFSDACFENIHHLCDGINDAGEPCGCECHIKRRKGSKKREPSDAVR